MVGVGSDSFSTVDHFPTQLTYIVFLYGFPTQKSYLGRKDITLGDAAHSPRQIVILAGGQKTCPF